MIHIHWRHDWGSFVERAVTFNCIGEATTKQSITQHEPIIQSQYRWSDEQFVTNATFSVHHCVYTVAWWRLVKLPLKRHGLFHKWPSIVRQMDMLSITYDIFTMNNDFHSMHYEISYFIKVSSLCSELKIAACQWPKCRWNFTTGGSG